MSRWDINPPPPEFPDLVEPELVEVRCVYCGTDLGPFDESEAHYIETHGAHGDYCACGADPVEEPADPSLYLDGPVTPPEAAE